MQITGATRSLPLIGHPVAQVRSPPGFNRFFERVGFDAVMYAVDVDAAGIDGFFVLLRSWHNCIGCSVTIPHKRAAARLVDTLTDRARRVGSVNIVRREADGRLIGDMTDGVAFCAALAASRFNPHRKRVAIVGAAGGAGAAIADAIADARPAALALVDLNLDRLEALALSLLDKSDEVICSARIPDGFAPDLAINATSIGMNAADDLPFDLEALSSVTLVADLVTKPIMTPLLLEAERRGHRIQGGLAMADAQVSPQAVFLHIPLAGGDSPR